MRVTRLLRHDRVGLHHAPLDILMGQARGAGAGHHTGGEREALARGWPRAGAAHSRPATHHGRGRGRGRPCEKREQASFIRIGVDCTMLSVARVAAAAFPRLASRSGLVASASAERARRQGGRTARQLVQLRRDRDAHGSNMDIHKMFRTY